MKIVMFSINPLFPGKVNGGSPKHLQNVALHLAELGQQVTILCTRHPDSQEVFSWHPQVTVKPLLKYKQPFPQPYAIPHYDLAFNLQMIADHLAAADRFYIHDGELLYPPIYQGIPSAISLRDNAYPETMLGSFLFQGDVMIAISEYSRQLYLNTAGRFIPELAQRCITIPNGVDWDFFKATPPSAELLRLCPVDPEKDLIVVHPHRPEPSKGMSQTVAVADRLVHEYKLRNLKVLVPRWFDASISAEVRLFYEQVETEISERGLSAHFVFHEWIPQRLMPQYYSLATVTLALGHFVEAFGNTVYESLGCGTPAIAARVATHRQLLPDHLLDKVHFGDNDTAAELAQQIITQRPKPSTETLSYLQQHYNIQDQLAAYAEAILGLEKQLPLRQRSPHVNVETCYRLAPWCYHWEGGFYHDFLASHYKIPALAELLTRHPEGFCPAQAQLLGIERQEIDAWFEQGYLVPILDGTPPARA